MKISNEISACKSCLYKNLLYGDLSSEEYDLVNASRTEYIFRRGEVMRREGEPINSFMYLREGLVKLYKTNIHGKDQILSINIPGDFINLLSIFSTSTYKYSISALEETKVCVVELSVIKKLVSQNSDFSMRLLNRISYISDEVIQNHFEINQKQVKGRVAYFLLFLADHIYNSHSFRMPVTRREVGELISMTTENTIRTLSEFRKDRIISMDGKTITILDYDRLVKVGKKG